MRGGFAMKRLLKKNTTSFDSLPLIMTVADIQRILHTSRAGAYKIMASDGFPKMKIGKRVLAEKDAFKKWLDSRTI